MEAVANLQKLSQESQLIVNESFRNSYVKGFGAINLFAMMIAILGLALSLWLIKVKTQPKIEM